MSSIPPTQRPIVILDSGVGGLSILKEIHELLPDEPLICVADNAGFPYGTKTEQQLIDRLNRVLLDIVALFNPKLVVLGCNSASTVALPALRARFELPIVGVVPAIKPAAARSQSKVIALLATEGTVERHYTDQLIADFAGDCQVIRVGSRALVDLAEDYLHGHKIAPIAVSEALKPLTDHPLGERLDQVVLGCTHFPLLKELIDKSLPGISLIDSGAAIAQRVSNLLDDTGTLYCGTKTDLRLYLTQACKRQQALSTTLGNWLNKPISVSEINPQIAMVNCSD